MEADDKRWAMYRIGICDDEIAFGNQVEKYLEEYARRKRIRLDISVFLTGEEYLEFLREGMVPDLLFLDIEFGGGMDGVKVGEMLRADLVNEATQIVYVSAVESYAMRLFRNRPMDFLTKPVKRQDIERVMNEYIRVFGKKRDTIFEYGIGRRRFRVAAEDIQYFQCVGRKVGIVTEKGENAQFYGNMDEVGKRLDEGRFWRIHKSYIVNVSYVSEFGAKEVCLRNGVTLPVSRTFRENVQEKLLRERVGEANGSI